MGRALLVNGHRSPFDLLLHYKHARVVDVVDALDGIGHFDIGLVGPGVRPLGKTMQFWGAAHGQRGVPPWAAL